MRSSLSKVVYFVLLTCLRAQRQLCLVKLRIIFSSFMWVIFNFSRLHLSHTQESDWRGSTVQLEKNDLRVTTRVPIQSPLLNNHIIVESSLIVPFPPRVGKDNENNNNSKHSIGFASWGNCEVQGRSCDNKNSYICKVFAA